jgi:NAD(P)-dependent dehydrogenase (short-subunit alcohol dehydrogenase family)
MSSQQKAAIVTGASQGIGAGIVKAFVERGFNVVANSRKVTQSTEVAASDHIALVDGHIGVLCAKTQMSRPFEMSWFHAGGTGTYMHLVVASFALKRELVKSKGDEEFVQTKRGQAELRRRIQYRSPSFTLTGKVDGASSCPDLAPPRPPISLQWLGERQE